MNNIKEMEETINKNVPLTFEEYAAVKEPAVNIIVRDYAHKLMEADKAQNGENATLTLDKALEIAKSEIPATFVPEWMKNLRVSANIAGTELIYLEALHGTLTRIEELLTIVFEDKIESHLTRIAESFKREEVGNEHE